MNALEVKNLSKQYVDFQLKGISFSLPMGTITGLVGRNGAGKTTTIKSIVGSIHPDRGQITILGQSPNTEIKQEIGVVYDECCFSDLLRLKQLDSVFQSIYRNWSSEVFLGMCEQYNLPANKKIKEYSRGMKQKLSIAAALAHNPKILLLDEPTGGLDPVAREEILDNLQEFVEDGKHTVLLSTHITTDLDRIADRILMISNGALVLDDEKDSLLENYCIVKGNSDQLSQINQSDILGLKKNVYSFEVLCKNRPYIAKKYPQFVIDRTDVEQILVLLEGGVHV